ncbi:MAG: Xaa-Pro peptidase family protein [Chloroflexota bacterium]|nr:Xaa-Pro peptidase family protein [Chloroflexota bacterium]
MIDANPINAASPELTEAEYERRALVETKHAQAVQLLNAHEIDCWLTFSREGSDLLLPFVMGADYLVGTAALLIFANGPSVAIVADYDTAQVQGLFDQVISYSLDWAEPLREILRDRAPASIAINYCAEDHGIDGLTHGLFLTLTRETEALNLADRFISAEPVTASLRAIKTPSELERMRRACEITQRIFDDLTGMLRPGLTEADVFDIIVERMRTYEVGPSWEASYCPSVAAGGTRGGHNPPGTKVIQTGETVRVDFGVLFEGYASDLQRTWYLRQPAETSVPAEIQHTFDAVRDGIRLAAELLRPGVTGRDVDTPVRKLLADRGFSFTHALGHQLGRLAHDGGVLLGPNNARYGARSGGTIEAGMVFTLEPCVAMIALEEDVIVTETGCEYLTPPQKELYLI